MSKPAFKARFAKRLVVAATGALLLTGVAAGTASAGEPPPADPDPGQVAPSIHFDPSSARDVTVGFLPSLAKSGELMGRELRQKFGPQLGIGTLPSGG